MRAAIQVDGLGDLRRKLRAAGEGYADLKDAGLAAADIVAKAAAGFVPQRTGRLAGSIRPAGQAKGAVVRAGKAAVPYAGPIHFGWPSRSIAPQPFLYQAADSRAQEVADLYFKRVQQIADDVTT